MSSELKKYLSTESYKGVRDFYPEDMFIENYIFDIWHKTAQSFGYVEYGASLLEPSELYKAKSSEEIINEQTYSFIDRGDREVTLRPEMTPTVARLVAGRKRELSFPLRWYSIPNLFRYERPQRGRLREHFQFNVDIFGVSENEAEIEIIKLAHTVLKNFGLKNDQFIIKVNDRAYFRNILQKEGLDQAQIKQAGTLLDKREKIHNFEDEWVKLTGKSFDINLFKNEELTGFVDLLKSRGISNVEIDTSLVRGFEYYSGIVFEVFDTNPENRRSLFGGGRYDNLVELFGEEKIPAVGFGMGDVTIKDTLETYGLLPEYVPPTNLYICILDNKYINETEIIANTLRKEGLNVAVDFSGKKLADQLKKADKNKVPYVICIGEEEVRSKIFKLKKFSSGEEKNITISEISTVIKGK